ncbi:hypothetical protein NXS19_013195 [Fusarium pseudograminearum]|uniref:Uncharacterized protein n=1 Tax=Fusarium pseudograminearum (strain CS3096) TaxID=1028729 RepID=K3VKN3_FUSPC|nr:hypothetical protein FPSE_04458 [Fusarium pseudograminearum CS3096]EKJ75377.1 hypothetical protein FPSE_04458 [Fusarium pseudograminearum CS3096]KAF0638107.1 hypothetical protein FPSE5266_04458 [Fusarium pseudograminearum]UZP45383.1 hypothetical protein NXS19_013195 [Fusarium pseudograminearum]
MPCRSSLRLEAKAPKDSSNCLRTLSQTKQENRVTKPKSAKTLSKKQVKATQKVATCLADLLKHDLLEHDLDHEHEHEELAKALAEAQAIFPALPSDLEPPRPLSELTPSEHLDYVKTLTQRRDEMAASIRQRDALNGLIERYNSKRRLDSLQLATSE